MTSKLLLPLMIENSLKLTKSLEFVFKKSILDTVNNMSIQKALNVSTSEESAPIEEHVKNINLYKPSEGTRAFEYLLNEKSAKAKLIKGAKRIPFDVEDNSSSSNLIFSVGSWKNAVLPSVSYWKEVKGNKSCIVGDYTVRVAGVKVGVDKSGKNVDTQVVFYGGRDKIVCHIYYYCVWFL